MRYVKIEERLDDVSARYFEKFYRPGDDLHAPAKRMWKFFNNREAGFPPEVIFDANYASEKRGIVFVYGITTECNKFVKFGMTKNPAKRLVKLQTSHPLRLTYDFMLLGPKSLEREIHKELTDFHVRGEWFQLTDEVCEKVRKYEDKALAYYNTLKAGRRYVGKKQINARRKADARKQW